MTITGHGRVGAGTAMSSGRGLRGERRLVCRGCGTVAVADGVAGLAPCLDLVDTSGFVVDRAQVVVRGLCAGCQAACGRPR